MKPDLTISLVNHSNPDLLYGCLDSIFRNTNCISYEIYVVDNATDGAMVDYIRKEFPVVRWIFNKEKLGFSANHNQILSIAKGRYTCILNDDTIIHESAFDKCIQFLDGNPEIGMLGPKLLNVDGSIQDCTFHFMSLFSELVGVCFLPGPICFLKSVGIDNAQYGHESTTVDWVLGACLFIRDTTMEQIGSLDAILSPIANTEEVDWCMRAKKAGWKVAYYPESIVTHYGGQSMKQNIGLSDKFRVEMYRTRIKFFRKHYGFFSSIVLRFIYCLTLPWNTIMLTQSLLLKKLDRKDFIYQLRTTFEITRMSLSSR